MCVGVYVSMAEEYVWMVGGDVCGYVCVNDGRVWGCDKCTIRWEWYGHLFTCTLLLLQSLQTPLL